MTVQERTRKQAADRLLRLVREGDRVTGTIHGIAGRVGWHGTVVDAHPFSPDGVSRVRIRWDDVPTIANVLPTSIRLDRLED